MIQGDLYCKVCFVRMFSEKGTYNVFGAKTMPKWMLNKSGKTTDSPRSSNASADDVQPNSANSSKSTSLSPVGSSGDSTDKDSALKPPPSPRLHIITSTSPKQTRTCVFDDCNNPRVPGKSWCEQHLQQKAQENANKASPALESLVAAIKARSINEIKDILHQHGPGICLEPYNRKSALQLAFSDEGTPACGEAMVETLADYLKDLEADVAMLKDQMTPDKDDEKQK